MMYYFLAAARNLVDASLIAEAAPVSYLTFVTTYLAMRCKFPPASRERKEAADL